jgi:hypothetical protein
MAIKFIQDILDEKEQSSTEKTLTQVLVKNMGKLYPERSHKTVHASDVTNPDFCARKIVLLDHLGMTQPDRYISAALKATFDIGSLVADRLVEDWIGDRACGHWVCPVCSKQSPFGSRPQKACCSPIAPWKHKEVKFFGEGSHISGSIDLIANLDGIKLKIVELKTIKPDDFDKLAAPLAEHRLRTRLYLKLIEDSTNPIRFQLDTQSAKILYISKGFGKMNPEHGQILPFKEFDVDRDDDSIKEYLQNGLDVRMGRETNTIPIKKVCDSIACKTAKSCPVKTQCWSGTIP